MRRLPLSLALALLSAPAYARVYPTPIEIDSEDDLALLYQDGLINEDEFNTLVELYNNPVNINEASRNQLFDLPGVTMELATEVVQSRKDQPFAYVGDLMRVPGFTPEILAQVEAFAYAEVEPSALEQAHGVARLRSVVAFDLGDVRPGEIREITGRNVAYPATYLNARARYGKTWEAGALGLVQEGIGQISYNPESRDFSAGWGSQTFQPGKGFVKYKGSSVEAIVGSYGAGFGVGLTFDRTNRTHPEGFYADLSVGGLDHYRLPKQLFGGAVRLAAFSDGTSALVLTGFASSQRYDLYMYDMAIAGGEDYDPLFVSELPSPRVFVAGQKTSYLTLPNAYRDSVAGLDVAYNAGPRAVVGVTGYAGKVDRTTIEGVDDPNAWVFRGGYPTEDVYGAAGVHGSVGVGPVDILGEGSVTFTGGSAFLVKAVATPGRGEIEASLRRYGTDFDNPHARGISAADQYEGYRDRDEQGARVRTQYDLLPWLQVRSRADLYQNISVDVWNLDVLGQVRFLPTDDLAVSIFGHRVDRNLALTGRSRVYGGSFDDLYDDEALEPGAETDRAGTRNQLGVQARYTPTPKLQLSAYYRRVYEDAGLLYPTSATTPCDYWFQIGQYTWMTLRVKPAPNTTITARGRYMDEDVHGSLGERFAEGYLEAAQTLPGPRVKLAVRGTLRADLPDAANSWGEACDLNGDPLLEGTCVVEPVLGDGIDAGETKLQGMAWLKAEVRF
ncbi:MAG: helix-hairpin-helix domain-containing protein [Alphaproteobacteria bacterium]|nr:helix-hairpin-helix domain-containing protein [Alphaproteobacteria bacterium]